MTFNQLHWQALRLTVTPEAVEAAEFALNSLDALGTETELIRRNASEVLVTGYFDQLLSKETFQDELHYALRSYGLDESAVLKTERSAVADTDWLAEWKKHWKPTTIGSFVIAAPWHEVDEPDKIVIRIEPNMAFGTGTHETTQLCLKAIDEHYKDGDTFLDVGTGTGILTIAAALKGGNTSRNKCAVKGLDTDPDAINIALENAELNRASGQVRFEGGSVTKDEKEFAFVCANLTLEVITPILPILIGKARKFLVLSGILAEQEDPILRALSENGIRHPKVRYAGEWIAIIVKK